MRLEQGVRRAIERKAADDVDNLIPRILDQPKDLRVRTRGLREPGFLCQFDQQLGAHVDRSIGSDHRGFHAAAWHEFDRPGGLHDHASSTE